MPRSCALIARDITKSYADVVVLDGLSLTVNAGERVGLVGPNGIGKSTLLRILAGQEEPDGGVARLEPGSLTVGYLAQGEKGVNCSPGQAARLALGVIVRAAPDVALLDEPTNDLDLAGLGELERFVASHRGPLVAASHDRRFLELMTAILDFESETRVVRRYEGGWSDYDAERRLARQRGEHAYGAYASERGRVEAQAQRMRGWQERGYGQGRKKKKGRDLAKATEQRRARLRPVEKPWQPWTLQFDLGADARGGDAVVGLEGAVIERGDFSLGPVDVALHAGERVAVVGPNGSGKSTLLAALRGELTPTAGKRWVGPSTVIGTLPQGAGPYGTGAPLLDTFVERLAIGVQEARALLAKFNLGPDDVLRPGGSLTPGERRRAVLAELAARKANALILDEPTNDLDIEAIEELESALASFTGAVVVVTHDRRFLEVFRADRQIELT